MRWIFFTMISVLLFAACNTVPAPTDEPFYTATPQVQEPIARPTGQDATLLDFAGGDPQELGGIGTFSYTVSGDVSAIVTSGNIVYNYIPAAGSVSARDKIFMSTSDSEAVQSISFEFTPGLGIGDHLLTAPANWFPGSVTGQYQRLAATEDGTTRIQSYSQNLSGSLTLQSVGLRINGTFEFTADWVTGNESGETVTRTVLISGQFNDVPYQRLDNPFDTTGQSVPERATAEPLVGSE